MEGHSGNVTLYIRHGAEQTVRPVLELALLVAILHIVALAAHFQTLSCVRFVSAARAARHIRNPCTMPDVLVLVLQRRGATATCTPRLSSGSSARFWCSVPPRYATVPAKPVRVCVCV